MDKDKLLEGKRILIVDDEPDVLDTLEDLLPMCVVTRASTFDQARSSLEDQYFDMAILDIMGVKGYELLKICNRCDADGLCRHTGKYQEVLRERCGLICTQRRDAQPYYFSNRHL